MISIWEKETFFTKQDIIIVGAGFAGLWAAFYLKKKKPHLKITILEKAAIPASASTRNAGFACFGSLTELIHDAGVMGAAQMVDLVALRYRGLKKIQKHFGALADFDRCGGFELFGNDDQQTARDLLNHCAYLNALLRSVTGCKRTFQLADKKLERFGFANTSHLVQTNGEGYLHPGKLLCSMLQKVQSTGVQVIQGVAVASFEPAQGKIKVEAQDGLRFSASALLICSNAHARELLPDIAVTPARGQMLLTSPIKKLPFQGTFHSEEGYYYFRNLGNRVLLGGARNTNFSEEETTEPLTSASIQAALERYLKNTVLPNYKHPYSIERRWAGIMGMGANKLPIVEQVQPGVFCLLGMGGIGVALAPELGKSAAAMMLR